MRHVNKIIKTIIYWDFFINSAWGLLGPIFAIFIVQNIAVGNIAEGAKIAGFASLFYWVLKSLLQIPIGKYLDKNHGEKDDFLFMVLGTFLTGLVPFGYLVSFHPWHIYLWQILHAVGMAMIIPANYAIFTRHIDKGKEAFEWGLDSTVLGLGVGVTGAVGGILAAAFGFQAILIITGTFTIVSGLLLLSIKKEISPKDKVSSRFPPVKPLESL
jgi:MFS family permease